MKLSVFSIVIFFLLLGCKNENEKETIYGLLQVCHDEYYLDFGVSASEHLADFESYLIQQGHLYEKSPEAYKVLFRKLAKEIYFAPPLPKDDFNNALLYKNPDNIIECMSETFQIDSTQFINLSYYKASKKIQSLMLSSEEVPIQEIFTIYANDIEINEYEMPFVKDALLLFLYRWYFTSKYDRSISIDLDKE